MDKGERTSAYNLTTDFCRDRLKLSICIALAIGFLFLTRAVTANEDDTADFQSMVNNAIAANQPIILPAGNIALSSTIYFNANPDTDLWPPFLGGLVFEGAGPGRTNIVWNGPPGESIFQFCHLKAARIGNFGINGAPALADLDFQGCGSSSGNVLENIINGNAPKYGVRLGTPPDMTQVSETTLRQIWISYATAAAFQLNGQNTLNTNFYNSGCAGDAVCVSTSTLTDPGAVQAGGNFNFFGGSISDSPPTNTPVTAGSATFLLGLGEAFNFVGVRVEDSGPLFGTGGPTETGPESQIAMNINWTGGIYINCRWPDVSTRIINYNAGGSFSSIGSLWIASGQFWFGGQTSLVSFAGDTFSVCGPGGVGKGKKEDLEGYFGEARQVLHQRLITRGLVDLPR